MVSAYEGKQDELKVREIFTKLETFHNVYPEHNFVVRHIQPEFNSICPKTSLPDFGTITLEFIPNELCVELKSFKLYLNEYRNIGVFMENSPNKIAYDVVQAIKPKWLRIIGDFQPRGGIKTVTVVEYDEVNGFNTPLVDKLMSTVVE